MTSKTKGILRSSPRYSTKANETSNNASAVVADFSTTNTISSPRQVRSLADLVKCSVQLNEEIRVAVVDDAQEASVNVNSENNPVLEEENDVTSTEGDDDSDDEIQSDGDSIGSGDEEILIMLGLSDVANASSDSDEDEDVKEKGSFRQLWEMLMQWTTPLTIQTFCQYNNMQYQQSQSDLPVGLETSKNKEQERENYTRNTIDVGASRRAGIMNMIRMNVSRSLSEIKKHRNVPDRRYVENRLAELVNTFDCSGPVANFDTKLWKGMTTILIEIVTPLESGGVVQLPMSIINLGLSVEEYEYLTQRAFIDLNQN